MAGRKTYEQRMKWFHKARFGMFIHYGLYAQPARGEWVMFRERIPAEEYAALADTFKPKKNCADIWARTAKKAGMKYAVLTTRHHDGFSLYDSKVSDFTSVKTACGRDIVAEYVRACRKYGIKVGLYYSLIDWRFPGYFEPRKYKRSARELVDRVHAQVEELMTNYGKIDVLWYDGDWVSHGRVEVDKAKFWRARALNAMVRKHQPDILINNRCGLNEDIDTPEQHVTASAPGRGWESCMTIGDSAGWGYVKNSPNMKTVPQLLQNLVIAAAGAGNYLLNVGPKPDGSLRSEETDRLSQMGKWLEKNGEAIYGSDRVENPGDWLRDTSTGMWTRKGKTAYLHIFRWPGREVVVPVIGSKATSAVLLQTGKKLKIRHEHNGRLVISGMPEKPPHPFVNTVKVKMKEVLRPLPEKDKAAWIDGKLK